MKKVIATPTSYLLQEWAEDRGFQIYKADPNAPSVEEIMEALRKASGYVSDCGDLVGSKYLDDLVVRLELEE